MRNCSTSRTIYHIYYDFTANRMLPMRPLIWCPPLSTSIKVPYTYESYVPHVISPMVIATHTYFTQLNTFSHTGRSENSNLMHALYVSVRVFGDVWHVVDHAVVTMSTITITSPVQLRTPHNWPIIITHVSQQSLANRVMTESRALRVVAISS